MMEPALLAVAYVHLRPHPNRFKAGKNLYATGIVTMVFHIFV